MLIFALTTISTLSYSNVYIYLTVNDKIITNYDIQKEEEYLKILNPDLNKLDKNKIFDIAKNSLINEKIKRDELDKMFDFNKELPLVDEVFVNLYKKLNYKNDEDFKNALLLKKNYSIQEIKEKLKIELFWNDLIFKKFRNQIKIDKKKFRNKINDKKNKTKEEFLLSEIFFNKKKGDSLDNQIKTILQSIKDIGFNNTANIYSTSGSAKFGGKIGWISENKLSKIIFENLQKIEINEFTDVITLGNNFLILKIEDKRSKNISINVDEELKEMISYERNKQLNQFSNIYFNKLKINYSINDK
jgi:peptidyl-prolyl cis-trans isomerase SurA